VLLPQNDLRVTEMKLGDENGKEEHIENNYSFRSFNLIRIQWSNPKSLLVLLMINGSFCKIN